MANSFERDLADLRRKYSLLKYRDCTPKEIEELESLYMKSPDSLPEDIEVSESYKSGKLERVFYHIDNHADNPCDDRIEYLLLKQTESLNSIRKMLIFFVVLTCISLIGGLLIALNALGC